MADLVRLNKWIADSGLCSRREADRLIEAGAVRVNGNPVTQLGSQIDPERDVVHVQGQKIQASVKVYLLFHKPKDCITTRSDEKGRQTIYDFIPPKWRSVDPAGRLDRHSTGALILSNDGDFLYQLTHPRFHLPKVYRVTVDRPVGEAALEALCQGVILQPEQKLARAESVEQEAPGILRMTLVTGYNRQIRRSLEALGYEVMALKRLSIGPIRLGDLKPGEIRPLTPAELRQLHAPTKIPPSRRRPRNLKKGRKPS
jgi:pseudouridine synthase